MQSFVPGLQGPEPVVRKINIQFSMICLSLGISLSSLHLVCSHSSSLPLPVPTPSPSLPLSMSPALDPTQQTKVQVYILSHSGLSNFSLRSSFFSMYFLAKFHCWTCRLSWTLNQKSRFSFFPRTHSLIPSTCQTRQLHLLYFFLSKFNKFALGLPFEFIGNFFPLFD